MSSTATKTQPIKLYYQNVPCFTTDLTASFEFGKKPEVGEIIRVLPYTLIGYEYHEGSLPEGIPAMGACIVSLAEVDTMDPRCNGGCD